MKMHKFNELYDEVAESYRQNDILTNRVIVLERILQNVIYASEQPMIDYVKEAMKQNEANKKNWK